MGYKKMNILEIKFVMIENVGSFLILDVHKCTNNVLYPILGDSKLCL